MYKNKTALAATLLSLALLAGCTGGGQSSSLPQSATTPKPPQSEAASTGGHGDASEQQEEGVPVDFMTYRGSVSFWDGECIEVEQLPGYNYGYERVRFLVEEDTAITPDDLILQEGAYVEVSFNGRLTRSVVPQGTAQHITIVANYSEGIIVIGTVVDVMADESGGHTVTVQRLNGSNADTDIDIDDVSKQDLYILHVPYGAMESISAADLTAGAKITAVTTGIASMSMPPQSTVHILLPYTE